MSHQEQDHNKQPTKMTPTTKTKKRRRSHDHSDEASVAAAVAAAAAFDDDSATSSRSGGNGGGKKVVHSYHDHANDVEEESTVQNHLAELSLFRPSDQNFTARLHRLLTHANDEGITQIISWQPHGRSFLVHDKQNFEQHVMPRWFQQSSMSSFLRQLNLYGFMRLHKGPDKGGYYHELFLRGKPMLCRRIERTRIKGRGARKAVSHQTEPDFYKMTPLPSDSTSTGTGEPGRGGDAGITPSAAAVMRTSAAAGATVSVPSAGGTTTQAVVGVLPTQQQQERQAGSILVPQQMGSSVEAPMTVLFDPTTRLQEMVNENHHNSQGPMDGPQNPLVINPSTIGPPQPLPSGIRAVDSTPFYRASPGGAMHDHPSSPPAIVVTIGGTLLSEEKGSPASASGNHASSLVFSDHLIGSVRGSVSQLAALPTAQSLASDTLIEDIPTPSPPPLAQAALSSDQPPAPPPPPQQQRQSSLDSLSNATLSRYATLPGHLANLYEPTPFPPLPSLPPMQALAQAQALQPQQAQQAQLQTPQPQIQAQQLQIQQNQQWGGNVIDQGERLHDPNVSALIMRSSRAGNQDLPIAYHHGGEPTATIMVPVPSVHDTTNHDVGAAAATKGGEELPLSTLLRHSSLGSATNTYASPESQRLMLLPPTLDYAGVQPTQNNVPSVNHTGAQGGYITPHQNYPGIHPSLAAASQEVQNHLSSPHHTAEERKESSGNFNNYQQGRTNNHHQLPN